jgi:hypothetical protein
MPEWHSGASWVDVANALMWRANETEFVDASPVKPAGALTIDPQLSDAWWDALNESFDALAKQARVESLLRTHCTDELNIGAPDVLDMLVGLGNQDDHLRGGQAGCANRARSGPPFKRHRVSLFRFSGGRLSDNPSRYEPPDSLIRRQPSGVTAP